MVEEDCFVPLEAVMAEVISMTSSTGLSSMAMMMLLRSWERQHGIRAAGVDGAHDFNTRRPESGSVSITRPSVR